MARDGLYQDSLETQMPAQLIRITIQGEPPLFPEISGHKNRFAIRFLRSNDEGPPVPVREDLEFTLTCCVL
jgi:cell division protein ZapD